MNFKTNLLVEIKQYYRNELLPLYGEKEADSLLNILIGHFFGLSRVDLSMNPEYRLSETEILKLHFAVKDLKDEKPVQYIIGETAFAGLKLLVNPDVLIPRPETEELVELIINANSEKTNLRILDVGTGSGCIALALKSRLSDAEVTAVDVSAKVLDAAMNNMKLNDLQVDFKQIDFLNQKETAKLGFFNVIVSNPPYVTLEDKKMMHKNVVNYEPHLALFVDDDPLVFYRAIVGFAANHLQVTGNLWFEINERFGNEICNLLVNKGFEEVNLLKDFHGKNRFVAARFVKQ